MTAVFTHSRSKASARLVLLALADVASDTGDVTAYRRSQTVLAAKANIDPKTVPRAIDALLELGELVLLDEDGLERSTREASGTGRRRTDYRVKLPGIGPDPAPRGDRTTRGPSPQDAGSDPAADGGQAPQGAGSITPSMPIPDPPSTDPPAGRGRKRALPDDFAVTDEMRLWAAENAPGVDVDEQTAIFRDHWISKAERRADWPATWRNWIRNAKRFNEPRRPGRPRPPAPPLAPRLPMDAAEGGRIEL